MSLSERALVNYGVTDFNTGTLSMSEGAEVVNEHIFEDDDRITSAGDTTLMVNNGLLIKNEGSSATTIAVPFENNGTVNGRKLEGFGGYIFRNRPKTLYAA